MVWNVFLGICGDAAFIYRKWKYLQRYRHVNKTNFSIISITYFFIHFVCFFGFFWKKSKTQTNRIRFQISHWETTSAVVWSFASSLSLSIKDKFLKLCRILPWILWFLVMYIYFNRGSQFLIYSECGPGQVQALCHVFNVSLVSSQVAKEV